MNQIRQNEKRGLGAKCKADSDCGCPYVCRFGGQDTYKCQITDTRGYQEACPRCPGIKACAKGLRCVPDNNFNYKCLGMLDIGAGCDSDDRCINGLCRKYGEGANTCQSSDTRKLGKTCYGRNACANHDNNDHITCDFNSNRKRVCCDSLKDSCPLGP
ncbi:7482_t:CDS:2 [Racocetra persica]|uniref:7482_t:CDS:1 n=1 Tax=Racocetra persica TaxID=160502 RepID=A0ACA9KAN3_9GLOM|nr:7482_t:CDS:2 [Racocetra persica]